MPKLGFVRSLAAALLLAVAACVSLPGLNGDEEQSRALVVEEYRLGPGDQLRVVVFGQPDLTGEFIVAAHGAVVFPLVGEIPAAGQTINEFTQALTSRLQEGYVRNPNVSVEVINYRPFYILGEVKNPGQYPFSAGMTVRRAVATAGGFTYRANDEKVYIQHFDEEAEKSYDLSSATPVHPGDTVRVPERRF